MTRRPLTLIAAALTIPALALAGCSAPGPDAGTSSNGSGSATPSSPSTSTTPAPSPSSAASSSGSAADTSTPSADEPCSAMNFEVALEDLDGGADAGGTTRSLHITNQGDACTLAGHPIVTHQVNEGLIVGAPAQNAGTPAPEMVVAPEATVTATVRERQAGKIDPADCRPTEATLLAVALRDGGETNYIKRSATACASTSVPLLEVGPYELPEEEPTLDSESGTESDAEPEE